MKRFTCLVLALAALVPAAFAASTGYTNNGNILVPPQTPAPVIDATNFINNGFFSVTPGTYIQGRFRGFGEQYDFSDVQNYTNRGKMISPYGFRFDNAVPNSPEPGSYQNRIRSRYFVNGDATFNANTVVPVVSAVITIDTGGILSANDTVALTNLDNRLTPALDFTHIDIDATNVINRGLIQVPNLSFVVVTGDSVDFSRGYTVVGNLYTTNGFDSPVQWCTNTGANFQADKLPLNGDLAPRTNQFSFTSGTNMTKIGGIGFYTPNLDLPFPYQSIGTYAVTQFVATNVLTTNKTVQVIYVNNPRPDSPPGTGIKVWAGSALAPGAVPGRDFGLTYVWFSGVGTNVYAQRETNSLLVADTLGISPASRTNNLQVFSNNYVYGSTPYRPTYMPANYSVLRTNTGFATLADAQAAMQTQTRNLGAYTAAPGAPLTALTPQNLLGTNTPTVVSNYLARGFLAGVTNLVYSPTPPSETRDLAGSLRLVADKTLDLNYTRIDSRDYLLLQAPHFMGSSNAIIGSAFCDINLGSTNGALNISNLLVRGSTALNGYVAVSSIIFTNSQVFMPGDTNAYPVPTHVMFVDADLRTNVPVRILKLYLTCTNTAGGTNTISIGDRMLVMEDVKFDTDNLVIKPTGMLDFRQYDLDWATQAPYLKNITNNSGIFASNTAVGLYFVSHDRVTGAEQPLVSFVNGANATIDNNGGNVFRAAYFENSGAIGSSNSFGPINIIADNVYLNAGGRTSSRGGDIAINALNFTANNHLVIADRSLALVITNSATTGVNNAWICGNGVNLLVKPTTGGFSGVQISSKTIDYQEALHTWAGADLGAVAAGFTNNGALGNLILTNLSTTLFARYTFQPAAATNALYVDRLDLQGTAGLTDVSGNYTNIDIKPGFTIYYANAFAGAVDISATLNGKFGTYGSAGGKFVRVVHSGGIYNRSFGGSVSDALTGGAGIQTDFKVTDGGHLTWNSFNGAQNNIYYKTSLLDPEWHLIGSFISDSTGQASFDADPAGQGGFYLVEVNLTP